MKHVVDIYKYYKTFYIDKVEDLKELDGWNKEMDDLLNSLIDEDDGVYFNRSFVEEILEGLDNEYYCLVSLDDRYVGDQTYDDVSFCITFYEMRDNYEQ